MSKKLIPVVIVVLLVLSAVYVYASPKERGPRNQPPGKHFPMQKAPHGKNMGKGLGHLFELDLSDKQIETIMDLKHKRQVKLIPIHREMRELAEERKMLREDPLTNKKRLVAIAERTGELKTQLKVNRIEGHAEMLNVLTQEQRTLLKEKKEEFKTRMKERRAQRGMRQDGPPMGYDMEPEEDLFFASEILYPEGELFEE